MRTRSRSGIRVVRALATATAVLAVTSVVILGPAVQRSDAATVNVSSEAEYLSALSSLSASPSGPHTINITADFTVTAVDGDGYYDGTQDLTIEGNGHTITGAAGSPKGFIYLDTSSQLTVHSLTIADFSGFGAGGAIYATSGHVVLNDTFFSGNTAPGDIRSYGGAVFSETGNVSVVNSTFLSNQAIPTDPSPVAGFGGAIFAGGGNVTVIDSLFENNSAQGPATFGGAIFASGTLAISNTTFEGNAALSSANSAWGGAVAAVELVNIETTLFVNNAATSPTGTATGGAIHLAGGGTVTNSTFANDYVSSAGNFDRGGAIGIESSTVLRHVTASNNTAQDGGATVYSLNGASLSITGSVLSDASGSAHCGFESGSGTSGGYNFVSDSSCFTLAGTDVSGSDPELNIYADNGGPTMTMEPSSALSPVVNVIPAASCTVAFDQRGVSRPRGANCDIGAVELLVTDSGVIRLAGDNRYGTAAAISAHHHPFGSTDVFVSTGLNFPDALAGAAAAGAIGAPLVLTGATIPTETTSELNRLDPTDLTILGGTGVVSGAIESALGAYGTTTRLASSDRYATAVAISQDSFPGTSDVVLVAVGSGFADALAGGPAAAKLNGPVLLTATNSVPQVVLDEITRLNPSTIIVLGGTGVISDAAYNQLVPLAPSITRLFGDSRYETAVAISEYAFPDASAVDDVYIADGSNFPDALAGAAEAAAKGVPILLTTSTNLPTVVADEIDRLGVTTIYILGGTGVVSPGVANQLLAHIEV